MCNFFSIVTNPDKQGGKRFYFDWRQRQTLENVASFDSHSSICKFYNLDEDECNKYEYNPLTKEFEVDQINSEIDDRVQVEEWVNNLDFKKIVEPLVIKPILNPFMDIEWDGEIKEQDKADLKAWASVGDSVRASVVDSVRDSAWESVWTSVRASVWTSALASAWYSVWASAGESAGESVWASVWAYISSFFDVKYRYDLSTCVRLWERGLVPSYDGDTWRLHAGEDAKIVYEVE